MIPGNESDKTQKALEEASSFSSASNGSQSRALWTIALLGLLLTSALLVWFINQVLLLLFAAILLGNFLYGLSRLVGSYTWLSYRWSLLLVLVVLILIIVPTLWWMSSLLEPEIVQLLDKTPVYLEQLRDDLYQTSWGERLLKLSNQSEQSIIDEITPLMKTTTGFILTSLTVIGSVIVVVVSGIFFASNPDLYLRGILHLIPLGHRFRAREVIYCVSETMWHWTQGQALAMLVVGALTTLGLYLLGMSSWLVLGIMAGVLSFIPNFGPISSATAAALLALPEGYGMVLAVIALYTGIQVLESNFITPLVQHYMGRLPPPFVVFCQILFTILFGFLGLLLAVPLTAVIMVIVKMLYVKDILGDSEGAADIESKVKLEKHQ